MIYCSILILLVFIQILNIIIGKNFNRLRDCYFIIISIIIFIVAAIRNGIGYDYKAYEQIYNNITLFNKSPSEVGVEFGYYFINVINKNSFIWVIILSAILGVTIKCIVINKYSEAKLMSLMAYFTGVFIMFDMGVIRQGIAMAFALVSIKYILNRNLLKFLVMIGIGATFHISIIVFIPLYFLYYIEFSRKFIYFTTGIVFIISTLDLTDFIFKLVSYLPFDFILNKLQVYSQVDTGNITISLIKRIVFLVIFVEFYKRKKINDKKALVFLNGYFLSIIVMCVFSGIDILGGRGSMNLYILQIFIFAIIINRLKYKGNKVIFLLIITLLSFNTMIGPIKHGNSSGQPYTPYKTIFNNIY